MRTEHDIIGERNIPENAFYGIHSLRAKENFPDTSTFHIEWYMSVGIVKKACYLTIKQFFNEIHSQFPSHKLPFKYIGDKIIEAMINTASEVEHGQWFDQFIVPAIQGGAGTSINMNVNEIITNASLVALGRRPGEYNYIDPVEQANLFQSTNDVIPTSLKVTAIRLLNLLEEKINGLRQAIEELEGKTRNVLRIGYTQMQEAVPTSYGRLFSTYNEALSRDWWRVSKCFERIKVVNLGGSAIGTGLTVPRYFIMHVVSVLQQITGLPVTRGENLSDATVNLDTLVEVHAILKAHAVNLEKMVNDLRLLSSDLVQMHEISIPKKQVGSSIMPGKVNPVIPEFVISAAHKIYANDAIISSLSAQGCLDLNAYLPVIGHALIESLKLLAACDDTIRENLITGLEVSENIAHARLLHSASLATALLPYLGYHKSSLLAEEMKKNKSDIFEANKVLKLLPEDKLKEILKPQRLLSEGFSVHDIVTDDE
jgi:aspartate ammonia-lyase